MCMQYWITHWQRIDVHKSDTAYFVFVLEYQDKRIIICVAIENVRKEKVIEEKWRVF